MRILFVYLILLCCSSGLSAQEKADHAAVQETIENFFEGMRQADTTLIGRTLHPAARLLRTANDEEGRPVVQATDFASFFERVASATQGQLDERITAYDIRIDQNLASAWTDFTFIFDGRLSHCGVNAFQLARSAEGWQIIQITDTQHRRGCQAEPVDQTAVIGQLLDDWHRAAANADADAFFGAMTPEAIYLGTDASERWRRDDMREWAQPYFAEKSAWAFTAVERNVYLSADQTMAWFEELLDTWMGECRGSGVMVQTSDGWKIEHYHLSVTVPNEKIQGFINLVINE